MITSAGTGRSNYSVEHSCDAVLASGGFARAGERYPKHAILRMLEPQYLSVCVPNPRGICGC